MLHSGYCNVAFLGGDVVIADRATLAVGAHEVLSLFNRVGEANVLKGEHVINLPPFSDLRHSTAVSSLPISTI